MECSKEPIREPESHHHIHHHKLMQPIRRAPASHVIISGRNAVAASNIFESCIVNNYKFSLIKTLSSKKREHVKCKKSCVALSTR